MHKILIVDGQKEVLDLMEATLTLEDYKIVKATNGKDAIDIARAEKQKELKYINIELHKAYLETIYRSSLVVFETFESKLKENGQ